MTVHVIGAGIIGLSTAVYIQEQEPRAKVTLLADRFSPDTTSDIAAGLWGPSYLSDPRQDLIKKWADSTFDLMKKLFQENAILHGVGKTSTYFLFNEQEPEPYWADCVPDFRYLASKELEPKGWGNFKTACFFTSYYLESKKYLPILLERFLSNGGSVEKRKLNSLNELQDVADTIVNCTGLGSYHLVGDKSCFPIRGQVYKVHAPFVKHTVGAEGYYIIPNNDVVTLGGTHQVGDWNLEVDKTDSANIWNGTTALMPSLKHGKVLGEYVGLRPGRPSVRLELENRTIGRKNIPVVHNYGHGGSGITLHHGCALDAAALVKKAVHKGVVAARL